jgi:hypothetical protein
MKYPLVPKRRKRKKTAPNLSAEGEVQGGVPRRGDSHGPEMAASRRRDEPANYFFFTLSCEDCAICETLVFTSAIVCMIVPCPCQSASTLSFRPCTWL